jgi:hypothetical protein
MNLTDSAYTLLSQWTEMNSFQSIDISINNKFLNLID